MDLQYFIAKAKCPRHWAMALAAALLLCLLAPFLYAFAFCFPAGDDFDEASRAMFLFDLPGGIYEIIREWLTWSGRYTYHFLAVFLGRAALCQLMNGIICFMTLAIYGAGMYQLARAANLRMDQRILAALMAIAAVCVCHQYLYAFYLLTDALTIGLQGGIYLLFLGFLCRYLNEPDLQTGSSYHYALLTGILAIGVYEHAALAIFFTLILFSWANHFKLWHNNQYKHFSKLFLWICAFICISFLAPGNFVRNGLRHVDGDLVLSQLELVFTNWLDIMGSFWTTQWPLLTGCMALFFATGKATATKPINPIVIIIFFVIFSLSLIILHALSDTPIKASPKLAASLHYYAAICWCAICWQIFMFLRIKYKWTQITILLLALVSLTSFFIMSIGSVNFREVYHNMAEGRLSDYGKFMQTRYSCLRKVAIASGSILPDFGLIWEIRHRGEKRGQSAQGLPEVILPSLAQPVFPVCAGEPLSAQTGAWPNPWAAWIFGLGGIKVENIHNKP